MKQRDRIAVTLVVNFIPAVIIPLIIEHYHLMDMTGSILLGVLVWIAITTTEILYVVHQIGESRTRELVLWATEDAFDNRLANIREAYRTILKNRRMSPDLFQVFFDERAAEFEKAVVEAATRNELHLERSHVVSVNTLLSSFTGGPDDVFRPVHFLQDNNFFFDIYAKQYFQKVHQLLQSKKICEIRRLMVYEKEEELSDRRTIRLLTFHAVTPRFSYRVMRLADFRSLARDFNMTVPRDFGVYGNRYVYCAEHNVATNIVGYWLRHPDAVTRFIRFFDGCWESALARELDGIDKTARITIDELFR